MNSSEGLVLRLCDASFLAPWAYANPVADDGREVADAIVVFGRDVIILSVKEYKPRSTVDIATYADRWQKKVIAGSVRQLRGAARRLGGTSRLREAGTGRVFELPTIANRKTHLISIALGGLAYGRFGSVWSGGDFVHVLDDAAVIPHFLALDTVGEFLSYLTYRKEASGNIQQAEAFAEEDWLGSYLLCRRDPSPQPRSGSFLEYLNNPAVLKAKRADVTGAIWDQVIIHLWLQRGRFLANWGSLGNQFIPPPSTDSFDNILRHLAIPSRPERRFLGMALSQLFLEDTKSRARIFWAPSGPAFVVLRRDSLSSAREVEAAGSELFLRCAYVQEMVMPDRDVMGLASSRELVGFNPEAPIVLCYLEGSVGTQEMRDDIMSIVEEKGIFKNLRSFNVAHDIFGIDLDPPGDEGNL